MHASLFTAAFGLATLSVTSARVLENRDTCWQDPAYRALWNPDIQPDNSKFCAGLLGLKPKDNCVWNTTATVTSREAITDTVTITTALTVPSTRIETVTNTILKFNKRDAIDAITDAPYLREARDAIKRQAGEINLIAPMKSACSCGNAAGKLVLTPNPVICTNTETVLEQGFATAYSYTATITSGITVVVVTVNETDVLSTSRATATSFAPVSLSSASHDVAPTFNDNGKWWRDHGWPQRSSTTQKTSSSTTSKSASESPEVSTPTPTTTATTTTPDATESSSTTVDSNTHTWGDWTEWNVTKSTSVLVDPTISDRTTTTPTTTSSTKDESTTTTTTETTTSNDMSPVSNSTTTTGPTSSTQGPPESRTHRWQDWGDYNITRSTTTSGRPVDPTFANPTTSSTTATANITTTTTISFDVSPTQSNSTTTSVANVTTHSGWQDWNVTKTSHMVEPTIINTTTTTTTTSYPNATTTSFFNTTTTSGYQNATTTSYMNVTTSYMVSPNLTSTTTGSNFTSTTASTTCPGQSTVYLGNLTTTIYETSNVTLPGSTITQFVSITASATPVTITKTKTVTKRPHWGGGWGRWGRGGGRGGW